MPVDGPTQTTKQTEWQPQPRMATAIRLFVLLAPAVSAFVLSFAVARYYPAWKLGMNPWVWWIGVFCGANLYLIWVDRLLSRLLPVATLFRISLVFPDQAPSRFKAALRATNSRSALKRIKNQRLTGVFSDETSHSETLVTLLGALSDHDRMTRGHAERVQAYCDLIAEELDLPEEDRGKLRWGALLHDMGKLDVPADILNKDGKPDDHEWKILQGHPGAGRSYVDPLRDWLGDWLGAVDEHHCRWDGKGYPYDLAGTDITLSGRIAAVADAYDVMTSVRSYKKAMAPEVAKQELVKGSGSQFDPEIVRAFLRIGIGQLRLIAGPLAWVASATGTVPAPIVGPAMATIGAAAAVVGGSIYGLQPSPPEELAYVETEFLNAIGTPLTVNEDESGSVQIEVVSATTNVTVTVDDGPQNGTLGMASSVVNDDGSVTWLATYSPSADYNGEDALEVIICSSEYRCERARVPIFVVPVQDAPVAADDYAGLQAGTETVVEPLANDSDVDGDELRIISVSETDGGEVRIDGDRIVFEALRPGRHTVTYVIEDEGGSVSEGEIVFDVGEADAPPPTPSTTTTTTVPEPTVPSTTTSTPPTTSPSTSTATTPSTTSSTSPSTTAPTTTVPPNGVPLPVDDDVVTSEDQSVVVDPLANDSDPDGEALAIVTVGTASSGTATFDELTGVLTYTPAADFFGSDSFTYTVADPDGAEVTATVVVTVEPVNDPPTATALTASLNENDPFAVVGSVPSSDVDNPALVYSIESGDPSGLFTIDPDTGEVRAAVALDHETAAAYELVVRVSDGVESTTAPVSITVLDVNERPDVTPTSGTLPEDAPISSPVAIVAATDPEGDALTYSISGGDPGGLFTIDDTGAVSTVGGLDHESAASHTLTVSVDDGTNTTSETVTVTVTDINEPPTIVTTTDTVSEDVPIGTPVLTIGTFDPEGAPLNYEITAGDPAGRLSVDGAGVVTTAAKLDYESHGGFTLTVDIDDGVFTVTDTVTLIVLDVNEPPATSPASGSVAEGATIGTTVTTLTADDPEGVALSYVIVGGDPGGQFAIDNAGVVTTAAALDFEAADAYTLTVEVDDGVFTVTETVTVTVVDENEPPVVAPTSGTVAESAPVATVVASLTATDPEGGGLTYGIVSGDPGGQFTVDGSGTVATAGALDFETVNSYALTVEVDDGTNVVPVSVDVTVTDVNETPVATPASVTVVETAPVGTVVGPADVSDPEGDALTFNITGGDPSGQFDIGTDGVVVTAAPLDAETTASYPLTVSASDGEFTTTTTVTVTVTDVDEPPVSSPLSVTVPEDTAVGSTIGTVSATDPEGRPLSFTIVSGDPGGEFSINPTGAVKVATELDAETDTGYSLTVEIDDGVNTVTETVTVTVVDVDEPPETSPLSVTLPENAPIGQVVGTVLGDDPEGLPVTFTITAGDPGGLFEVDSLGRVTTVGTLDHETAASHSLTVEVSDGLLAVSVPVTIIVSDVDEPPVTAPASATVSELVALDATVVVLSATDPESAPLTFTITAGDPGGNFTVDSAGAVKVQAYLDYENATSHTLTVNVDDGVHSVDETVIVNVTDWNEGPTAASSTLTVVEGGSVSSPDLLGLHTDPEGDAFTVVGIFTDGAYGTTVVSGGSSITYTHGGGESLSDTVVYELRDSFGVSGFGTVDITVTPVNDPPVVDATADQPAYVGVAYSQLIGTTDPDNSVNAVAVSGLPDGLTHTFSAANGEITISGTPTLATLDTTYPVTVTATDNLGVISAPMTFNIVVDPIGRSPYAGLIAITEVLYAESEPYDVANPTEPTLMDEYLEITNLAGYQINVENFSVTDTEDPAMATDFQYNTPPYLPQHTGRINQAFTQFTPLASGRVVTAPIRRPDATSYQMQDGSVYPAESWNLWFSGIDYGFPPGQNSNWEAFENSGDDIWLWDPDGLLVAFVAWDDGSADTHIASRPPEALGVWDSTHEGRLAGAANGHSISLAVGGDNSTSACWELTGSGAAAASGCGSVATTRDIDPQGPNPPLVLQGRVSSQGEVN